MPIWVVIKLKELLKIWCAKPCNSCNSSLGDGLYLLQTNSSCTSCTILFFPSVLLLKKNLPTLPGLKNGPKVWLILFLLLLLHGLACKILAAWAQCLAEPCTMPWHEAQFLTVLECYTALVIDHLNSYNMAFSSETRTRQYPKTR